jgi:hypothetical protein
MDLNHSILYILYSYFSVLTVLSVPSPYYTKVSAYRRRVGMGVTNIRFGFYAGLLIGLLQAGIYPYLAILLSLGAAWFIGGLLQGMVAGITISAVYRN